MYILTLLRSIGSPALLLLPLILRVSFHTSGQQLPKAARGGEHPLLDRLALLLLPKTGSYLLLVGLLLILPPWLPQPLTPGIWLPHVPHVTYVLPFRTWRLPVWLPTVKRLRLLWPHERV